METARLRNAIHLADNLSIHLVPGRQNPTALDLSQTLLVPSFKVALAFADPLPTANPPLPIRRPPLIRDLIQCRPIRRMIVLEVHLAAIRAHQLGRRDVLAEVLVEFQLLARERVDEGRDELEEAPYRPWDCMYIGVSLSSDDAFSSGYASGLRCRRRGQGEGRNTIDYQSPPQPLRIVRLQDIQRLPSLPNARIAAAAALLEVHKQT